MKCPICAKPSVNRYRPFCSKRCADVDLAHWLRGDYAIPGPPADRPETEDPD
ncbi:MAG: DNA gyrase inhibitor YacG [Paracoccus sp. (in: a-proteobacteria)]|nr:DNA gyrase inhibitor YacG [Paracoccus sp. (in: a-proteobacteria)]